MATPVGICASAYVPTWMEVNTAMAPAVESKRSMASRLATPKEVRPVIAMV